MDNMKEETYGFINEQKSALLQFIPFLIGFLLSSIYNGAEYITLLLAYLYFLNDFDGALVNCSLNVRCGTGKYMVKKLLYCSSIFGIFLWFVIKNWMATCGGFWSTFYCAMVIDFLMKHFTMITKSVFLLFVLLYRPIFKYKGNVVYMIESVSQFLRSIFTLLIWYHYIVTTYFYYRSQSFLTFILLFSLYTFLKLKEVSWKFQMLKQALVSIGSTYKFIEEVDNEELGMEQINSICPICHMNIENKVKLSCEHYFCNLCIIAWFDVETYCPECLSESTLTLLLGEATTISTIKYLNAKLPWKSFNTDQTLRIF